MKIEVSNSEIVDKFTILKIKELKINDSRKLKNIKKEIEYLKPTKEQIGISEGSDEYLKLMSINYKLWTVEDEIRESEKLKKFDDTFISLARTIYTLNDERSRIKKEININTNSILVEEKNHDLS